ncbi:Rieske (2Fe-2S) protein, partial [Streptomyces griseiscabiei]
MTSETIKPSSIPGRRTVMAAAGVAGLTVALTACGSDDDSSASVSSGAGAGGDAGSDSNADASSGSTGGDSAGGKEIAKTSDIPEGGGKIFASEGVVVTQPEAGSFKAFSSVCTHQG